MFMQNTTAFESILCCGSFSREGVKIRVKIIGVRLVACTLRDVRVGSGMPPPSNPNRQPLLLSGDGSVCRCRRRLIRHDHKKSNQINLQSTTSKTKTTKPKQEKPWFTRRSKYS